MRKKLTLLVPFVMFFNIITFAQNNAPVNFISEKISKQIYQQFDNLPNDEIKIYFSYLFYNDTSQTKLSLDLSRQTSNNISANLSNDQNRVINKKNTNIKFIYSNILLNTFNKEITENLIPKGDDNTFWDNFKQQNTPDFYIFGAFDLQRNNFIIREVHIVPNPSGKYKNINSITISQFEIELDNNQMEVLKKLNISLNEDDYYSELISFKGLQNDDIFDIKFLNLSKNSSPIDNYSVLNTDDTLLIMVNPLRDMYIYTLYFDPEDIKNDPNVYFLQNKTIKYPKDEWSIIQKIVIPEPIDQTVHNSNIYIKIIAVEDWVITDFNKMSPDKIKDFLIKLKAYTIYTHEIIVIRE